MAVAIVSFTQRASAGSQAVTGVGFQPTAVILWTTWRVGTGLFNGAEICEGAGDGTTQFARSMSFDSGGSAWSEGYTFAAILRRINTSASATCVATLASLDADGFTLSWSASDAGGATIHAIALGGTIESALVKGTLPSSATTAITGAGFSPTAALVWAGHTGTPLTGNSNTARHSWGFAAGSNQCCAATLEIGAFGNIKRVMNTLTDDAVAIAMQETGVSAGGMSSHHRIDSFDSDGVTFSDASGSFGDTADVAVLCLRGVTMVAGEVQIPTSPGTVAETAGVRPELLLFHTVDLTLGGSAITSDARFGIGCWTNAAQVTIGAGVDPGLVTAAHTDTAIRIYQPDPTFGSSTLRVAATVSSIEADGFTLACPTVTGASTYIQYFAIGPDPAEQSSRNLLTGSSHTVQGDDNLIVGANGTVNGDKNALFALCDDSPAPVIVGDKTFMVCADAIDLEATTIEANGLPVATVTGSPSTGAIAQFSDAHTVSEMNPDDASTFLDGASDPFIRTSDGSVGALDDLTDVAITAVSDGDVLTYDSGSPSGWKNAAPTGSGGALDDLSDVTITAVADGDVLTFDSGSGEWINSVPTGGGSGNATSTTAFASPPGSPASGDLDLYTDSFYVSRYSGSAWVPWGPIFPCVEPSLASITTWVNQGGATVTTTNGGIFLLGPAGAGVNLRCRVKAAPSTPYTITAMILPHLMAVNFMGCGLLFRDSASGKMASIALVNTAAGWTVDVNKWTDATTFSAQYVSGVLQTMLSPVFLRIADNGTNRISSLSNDGINWRVVHTVGRTDFLTANQVGFFVNCQETTWDAGMTLLSWKEA